MARSKSLIKIFCHILFCPCFSNNTELWSFIPSITLEPVLWTRTIIREPLEFPLPTWQGISAVTLKLVGFVFHASHRSCIMIEIAHSHPDVHEERQMKAALHRRFYTIQDFTGGKAINWNFFLIKRCRWSQICNHYHRYATRYFTIVSDCITTMRLSYKSFISTICRYQYGLLSVFKYCILIKYFNCWFALFIDRTINCASS